MKKKKKFKKSKKKAKKPNTRIIKKIYKKSKIKRIKLKSKKKFSKEQEQIIRDMRNQMKQVSMSDFVKHLEITNNINIGIATLRKILNNKY